MKKNILSQKNMIIAVVIIVLITLVIAISLTALKKEEDKNNVLNKIVDVSPDDIQIIYRNTTYISCEGDLFLNIKLDSGKINVDQLEDKVLINYVFSLMEKDGLLNFEMDEEIFIESFHKLIDADIDLLSKIKDYKYGEYTYNYNKKKNIITRKETGECTSEISYYSEIYGYTFNENLLSVDINIGYIKDDNLYGLDHTLLGEYTQDYSITHLFEKSPYYRYNFTKKDGYYKLNSVELNKKY